MKVSVIIPYHNAEKYIEKSILSVINQSHDELELICINDGSTDGSEQIAKNICDSNNFNTTFLNTNHEGPSKARNVGVVHSTGKYIQFLDADDWLLPDKISKQVELAITKGFPELIVGSFKMITEAGEVIQKRAYVENQEPSLWLLLMRSDLGNTCSNLFKRSLFERSIKWNENIRTSLEYDLMFQILKQRKRIVFDNKIMTVITRRDSGSHSQVDMKKSYQTFLELRLCILRYQLDNISQKDKTKFLSALFDGIRQFYPIDKKEAIDWHTNYIPKEFVPIVTNVTGSSYILFYKLLGFNLTEKLRIALGK